MARRRQYALADGTTATPTIVADGNSPTFDYDGGNAALFVVGTFGGGTAKLQMQAPDGSSWCDIGTGVSFTANGVGGFIAPAGQVRLNLAGSAGPSIKAWVVGMPQNVGG